MTHPVKGDSGRQHWFQAGSVSFSISNQTRNGAVNKLTEAFQGKNISGVGKLQLFRDQNGCVLYKERDVALAQCSAHAALTIQHLSEEKDLSFMRIYCVNITKPGNFLKINAKQFHRH